MFDGAALLGGALTRVGAGLPFLVAGLLNIGSVAVALAFFARLEKQKTLGTMGRTGELDIAA